MLQEAGKIIGIELLDHIVVGENGTFTSMKEKNLI
jgi:DNA repair protein RadC